MARGQPFQGKLADTGKETLDSSKDWAKETEVELELVWYDEELLRKIRDSFTRPGES